MFIGTASFVNAQTTQTDSTTAAKTTTTTAQSTGNPTIDGLKNKSKPTRKIPKLWQN
jgi:hypothetical protein